MIYPDLFEFAYVPSWYDRLGELAAMAVPEPWRFKNPSYPPKNTDTPILEKYIHFVFKKQVIDFNNEPDQMYADSLFHLRNEVACFHTGLFTRDYRQIYGCFTRNKRKDSMLDWYFRGFADNASSAMKYVQPLPERPAYLLPQSGMNYFPEWDIRVNVAHILGDPENVARLPEEMQKAKNLPLLLETAVELGRRKATFEPGIVVPQGYQGKVQFLLPIHTARLLRAIAALPAAQRELVLKVTFGNRSIADIAREEDVDESSVRERLRWAYKKLRKLLA